MKMKKMIIEIRTGNQRENMSNPIKGNNTLQKNIQDPMRSNMKINRTSSISLTTIS